MKRVIYILSEEMHEAIRSEAFYSKRKMSEIVREAISEYFLRRYGKEVE